MKQITISYIFDGHRKSKTAAITDDGDLVLLQDDEPKPMRGLGDAVAAGAQREENDAGEGAQVHEQIGRHVKHHRGEAFLGAADQADHHESRQIGRAHV